MAKWKFLVKTNFLDIEGLSRHHEVRWSISTLIERFQHIDINPPYQRDLVWTRKFKQDYILAVFEGTATAQFHFVEKSEELSHHYWCMDAKQRYSTIKEFVNDEFKIKLECDDGKYRLASFGDLKKKSPQLVRDFEQAQISVELYEPMSMRTQQQVFEKINQNVPLSQDERLYGSNILTQAVLKSLFLRPFARVAPYMKPEIRNNTKKKALRYMHILMMLAYGKRWDEEFGIKGYEQEKRTASAHAIEKSLEDKGLTFQNLENDYSFSKETLEECGLDVHYKQFDNACRWLKDIITYDNAPKWSTNMDATLLIELLGFLLKMQQNKAFNNAYIQANIKIFFDFINKWYDFKLASQGTDYDLTKRTQDRGTVERRFRAIEDIANECGIDTEAKSRGLTAGQKFKAALNAGHRDPIDGRALTEDNIEFDHVMAASQTGDDTPACAISSATNQIKSSLTRDQAAKVEAYIGNQTKKGYSVKK